MNPYSSITNVRKSQCTPAKDAIRNAFLQMYKGKALCDISVKKLCEAAHVARTTFYANYINTDSLLEEIEDDLIVDLLEVNNVNNICKYLDSDSIEFTKNLKAFVEANMSTLQVLLIDQPDLRLIEKWKLAVKYHFWEVLYSDKRNFNNSGLILEIIASMAVGAYAYVLMHPSEITQKEITKHIIVALHALEY